jgi:hypothetical protein
MSYGQEAAPVGGQKTEDRRRKGKKVTPVKFVPLLFFEKFNLAGEASGKRIVEKPQLITLRLR